jgi:DNA-binding LacI/PurR family transcriptional regulator
VPKDISVVGFDDIALAGLARVSLTSIWQPRDQLARLGVELLLERINGETHPLRHIRLKPKLVRRGSTAERAGATELEPATIS